MFKTPFSFNGRISRTEYIISTFIWFLIQAVGMPLLLEAFWIGFLIYVLAYWFWLAQGAKRCHDFGQAGWIQIIPVINPIVLWLFQGTAGQNQYGPDPRNPNAMAIPSPAAPSVPAPRAQLSLEGVEPPPKVPEVASFRCTSCGAQNKDIRYTQSPCCEFCGAPHVRK